MPFEYFNQDRLIEIAEAVITSVGYEGATRSALMTGIVPLFVAALPGSLPVPPMQSISLDLGVLNSTNRLTDGTVPLKIWLRNAARFSGGKAEAEPLRAALEEIEILSTGAPRLNVTGVAELREVVVHHDDMVPHEYMRAGLAAANAVAKLSVIRYANGKPELGDTGEPLIYLGTGWLIDKALLLTNHHVVNARDDSERDAAEADLHEQAASTTALFDYNSDASSGHPVAVKELVAWDPKLDYALLRIEAVERDPLQIGEALAPVDNTRVNLALNIIQHPDGRPKKFAIRNNLLTAATDTELRYFTDTLGGSSGSPVLDDRWRVVGLHRGATRVRDVKFNGQSVAYVNVGSQLSAIKRDLLLRYAGHIPELGI
ncbi:trypsin-like peptidase domain-containing protein [Bradyrhizobium sp. USDA 3364]